ncbi:hypothetical protein PVAP13_7KG016409 [Panicum virgatum]|uniref:Uncharacterized protein n=1 Tax=Panicum virgatum TaxID=38727 RepID=A0A8T0QKC5_PANVG|nr:hypothetical protein PVAP13_7KG016409 [Panicum virgatum]
MWPKSDHGFFMYPPLLKATAGIRRHNRFKSSAEGGTSTKGRHKCPICKDYGHHLTPKHKKKAQPVPATTERSLMPVDDPLPARMLLPAIPSTTSSGSQRNNTRGTRKKRKKASKTAIAAKKQKNSTPSTASESIKLATASHYQLVQLMIMCIGSPALNTRSKVPSSPDSPAMGTRSKRKLHIN